MAQHPPKAARALAEFSSAITELAASARPSVVQIDVRRRVAVESGDNEHTGLVAERHASGSGVIIDGQGFIVTNAHVIEGAQKIDVRVVDPGEPGPNARRRHYNASVIGIDKETDLALLKIAADHLPALSFYDSDELKQGQVVLALGSPLGLENSLTVGFVSAPHRHLEEQQPMYYVQTDAAINPGSSGGPLLDIEGRLVGLNTLIMSQSGGSEGIGFAIPSNTVQRVCKELRAEGRIRRGAMGVLAEDISPVLAKALGLSRERGVILSDVKPDSSAEAAGLQTGDIVVALDGKPITAVHELIGIIFEHKPQDVVAVEVERAGERLRKNVTVMERSSSRGALEDLASRDAKMVRELGILAVTVDDHITPLLPDLRRLSGVVVVAIPEESTVTNPGLTTGDVIYEVNGKRITSVETLEELLPKKTGDAVALLVERDGRLIYVSYEVD
jgi:serine protease Do